jgi:hypothetical protein
MTVVSVQDVKDRLNKTLTVDDTEIQSMIDAALAEYVEWVQPLPGSVTETVSGGGATVLLRSWSPTSVTSAAYTDGTVIDVTLLDLDTGTGVLGWGAANATTVFTSGRRNLVVTYVAGDVPANHKETIIADVAGYFEHTQNGPAGRPGDGYADVYAGTPMVLFPRIRALAVPAVG